MPGNEIQCLLQTSDGYLWVGTRSGLARFDGLRFMVFNCANTPLMDEEDCRSLVEDDQGNLWLATRWKLFRLDSRGLREMGRLNGLCGGDGYRPYSGQRGELWFASHRWLTAFTKDRMTCYGESDGLMGDIFSLAQDHHGVLWVGQGKALQWFDPDTAAFSTNFIPSLLERTVVNVLQRDAEGRMWAAFEETEIRPGADAPVSRHWVHWFAEGEWQSCPGNPHRNDGRPFFILADPDGSVWMPGGRGKILRINEGNLESFTLAGEGEHSWAQCAMRDREGQLWIGTESAGLQRWSPRKLETYAARDGLPNENSWTICEGRDGSLWIGTDGGVSRLRNGEFVNFSEPEGLLRKEVRSVVEDGAGIIWAGTMSGLYFFRNGKFSQYEFPGEWFEGKIRAMLPTRDGALWVAAATGLNRLENGARTKLTTADGLANHDVRALLQDSTGRLWIGSHGGGLQSYHEGRFTSYHTNHGLSSGLVWALHEDAEGALWIGTASGLNRLRDGKFTVFGTAHGLPDNLVNFILEDDFGQLWISHDRGIYRVRRSALNELADGRANRVQCVSYHESDGLPSQETNGQKSYPAGCKTRDGRLWFPTTRGVVVFDPKLHKEELSPPKPVIEQVRATGNLVYNINPHDPFSTEREKAAAKRTGIFQLPAGSGRVLEFNYTANTFVSAEKTRFRYRMLGLDEKWIEAGERREAIFTNLKPGKYRFEVTAGNHHDLWDNPGAAFPFHIAPFMHQTWWFYGLCGGVSAALVCGFIVWRTRELRRIHRLEQHSAITAERSRIAKDLHDGLGADLTRLTMLADLASGESGSGGGEHLRKLSQSSREAARELKELIWIASPANVSLDGLVSRICQSAQDFLHDARIQCRLDIAPCLPEQPVSLEQRRNLLLVAREALNNVVKHAGATEVCIRATVNDGTLSLVIEDNGHGFNVGKNRHGLGLESMRKRIENLGGLFTLESRVGAGTKISIGLTMTRLT